MIFLRACLVIALSSFALYGCGGDSGPNPNADNDGDGFSPNDGDCDDINASFYPGAPEPCDGKDQNCDGIVDGDFDQDNDGFTTCGGDCRDNDPLSNPVQGEVIDGFDNDCDGIVDNHTDQYDDDGDGFSEDQGDCDDSDSTGHLRGPNAIEVQVNADGMAEGLDNDCDGLVDEATEPCPTGGSASNGESYAHAMDVCAQVASSGWDNSLGISSQSRRIVSSYGNTYAPHAGPDMVVLSTGLAGDTSLSAWVPPEFGTEFTNTIEHPDPQGDPGDGCGEADADDINDYTELKLSLNVPSNANGISFDFNFMSGEYPEFVCTSFDDTFLAILESQAFAGNVSFDGQGNRMSINSGFFDVCAAGSDPNCNGESDLTGTGYTGYGGTGWLTTTAPVIPGEKITITFMIFDEGDRAFDSTVLLDYFRWEIEEVDSPTTVERLPNSPVGKPEPSTGLVE